MGIQDILDNHHLYSTKFLNRYIMDIDEIHIVTNKYFVERQKYIFKKGKYNGISYYMMSILYPDTHFYKWFIENGSMTEDHREFLRLLQKRRELLKITEFRMKKGLYKGVSEFDL